MKKTVSTVIIFMVFLGICSGAWAGGGKEKQNDLAGMYIGIIPAADCPGIAVVAILNTEGKYYITYQYIERGVEVFPFTGTYTWDEKTKIITLDSGKLPRYYKAGKNSLTQLDMEGKEITGNLGDLYKLRKVRTP